jgi:DNA-binding GntR family transcriptional regulator
MSTRKLKAGDCLLLGAIAIDLEVSITPISEAFTQLDHSRIIKSPPNCGFIIP